MKTAGKKSRLIVTVVEVLLLGCTATCILQLLPESANAAPILQFKWKASNLTPGCSGAIVADVNGDGIEEVLHAGKGRVTLLSGKNGSVLWRVSDTALDEGCQPQMADLNKDGKLEIIVPLQNPAGVLTLFRNGQRYWRRTGLGRGSWAGPVVADIDGDGYPTIFVASTDVFDGLDGTGRVTALSYTGTIIAQTFAWRPCSGGLSLADSDNDGEFELYMTDRNMYYPSDNGYGKGVRSFWARNLTERWNYPDILCSSHKPMLADVNKDGVLEVIAGHQHGGIVVLNATNGHAIRKTFGIPNDAPIHYQPSIYDIDRDGNVELLMADGFHDTTSKSIVIWDLVNWKVDARLNVGLCKYGPQVGNVDGDGVMDIIACNYTGIFVFNKAYSLIAKYTGLQGILNYAVVQDIDNDGYNEIIVTSEYPQNSIGVVYAFDTISPRSILRARTEVQFYSERRLGAAEYVPSPTRTQSAATVAPTNEPENIPAFANYAPIQGTPKLVLNSGNLICYNQSTFDYEGDKVTNIYKWYRNGISINNLLLPFDTRSLTTVKDYSGKHNDGTASGEVAWISKGRLGGCYQFNGGHIKIPGTQTLDGGGQWSQITVELWIYLTADQSGTRVLTKLPSYEIGITGANRVFAGIWVSTGVWNVSGYRRVEQQTSLSKYTWYHVAFTYQSSTGLKLYVNGILVASKSLTGKLQTSGSEPLYLGWFDQFKGRIDEVRIYPDSLSAQQIRQRYLDTVYGTTRSSTIVSQETQKNEIWKCEITPNDSIKDGIPKFSNTLTIR